MSDEPAPRILSYSAKTAAAALEVEPRTILRACKRGMIKHSKIGNLIRIHYTEVERIAVEGVPGPNSAAVLQAAGMTVPNYKAYKDAAKAKARKQQHAQNEQVEKRTGRDGKAKPKPLRRPSRDERRAQP